jgi:hypothetical protein
MRLSEAMMLGSTMCKLEPCNLNSCAFGSAMNALGIPQTKPEYLRYTNLMEMWPWLDNTPNERWRELNHLGRDIYAKFDYEVCNGYMTLEALADYVRSIEPECGDCCKFECTCKSDAVAEPMGALEAGYAMRGK